MGAFAGWLHHPAHTLTHHENNFLSHKGRLNSCFFHVNGKKRNLVIFFAGSGRKAPLDTKPASLMNLTDKQDPQAIEKY
ncbi:MULTISPECIES: hypothetical protein [Pseudochrobactrum]|uniref:Uncharacterized protein n=1 Tax=Pseudochrobactrum saccharolyticum TaxID=354352 RepID=A0A7W8EQG8_9HYPH|nr:hypothetical protein [Pseudochrobactrum saccharolyticum]KAB0537722.1 hypothetical protein F7P81_13490 [Pseudochrobactrum saccharolyticum]MBB5091891.1 hypothetical protein [Pseudochrobactrum saccharolyticum]